MVTRGGMHTGEDAFTLDVNKKPWVRKVVDPLSKLNPTNENETYHEVHK